MVMWFGYEPRRADCPDCGVTTEEVPWAASESRFTWEFEELTAYLAQITDKTTVSKVMGTCWRTVGRIVERVVARKRDDSALDNLKIIGVDEFSYGKGSRFITTVTDHVRRRVVWSKEGRSYEVLKSFFQTLGLDRCFNIQAVTIDMSGGYQKAIEEWLPQADIAFDRFHVQQLASDAVDEVRRAIVHETKGTPEAKEVKGSRFVLLKKPENLSAKEKWKLSVIQVRNKRLYRAYLLKETLSDALDYYQPARAEQALRDWLAWASRSRLKPFMRVARTIRRKFDGIMTYVRTRLTNGLVEGINNKLRMVTRRAFGFHSATALMAMLFLTCGGIQLNPPLP
jgi:transposase